MDAIKKVAIVGSGLMGSGIAAQVANSGHEVLLLDLVPENGRDRNQMAKDAINRLLKAKPAAFMHKSFARLVTPGNLEDDIDRLADADWICEAVVENVEIKRKIYSIIENKRRVGSIVSSNTSTIPVAALIEGLPESFARDFVITHFFNPPRYMRLVEMVGGSQTRPEVYTLLQKLIDLNLGKTVIQCKDTPGFIANRIGIYWTVLAMSEAIKLGLTVEEADSIVGRPMGIPATGIFGLADLAGIDLAPSVSESMLKLLPPGDRFCQIFKEGNPLEKLISGMIDLGRIGRKSGAGFYRRRSDKGKYLKEALDLDTGEYRALLKPRLASAEAGRKGLRELVNHPDKGGRYAWIVLSNLLCYAAELVPEISDDIISIDTAMKAGYAWKKGPFEQIDELGGSWFCNRLMMEGMKVPKLLANYSGRPFYKETQSTAYFLTDKGAYQEINVRPEVRRLADFKRGAAPIKKNNSASLWDIGDDIACLELHSKMNAIDQETIEMLVAATNVDRDGFKGLLIGGDYDNFSVGANVGIVLFAANAAMWPVIEQSLQSLQKALLGLKYAKFPVVSAVAGMTLGGGCEIALHSDAVQVCAESYMGLVEVGVGVVPAGGGCKELLLRASEDASRPRGPMPPVLHTFETISMAKVGTSAEESRRLGFLRDTDRVTMNRERLLVDAKRFILDLIDGYTPPVPPEISLPGLSGKVALEMTVESFVNQGKISKYDSVVGGQLANILSGGDRDMLEFVTEKELLAHEREAFMTLVKNEPTLDRIEHMLESGKPLRN